MSEFLLFFGHTLFQTCLLENIIEGTRTYFIGQAMNRNRDVSGFGRVLINPMTTFLSDLKPSVLFYEPDQLLGFHLTTSVSASLLFSGIGNPSSFITSR